MAPGLLTDQDITQMGDQAQPVLTDAHIAALNPPQHLTDEDISRLDDHPQGLSDADIAKLNPPKPDDSLRPLLAEDTRQAITPDEPYAQNALKAIGAAGERYPAGIMKSIEDLQAGKTPDVFMNIFGPNQDPRSATEIAQTIGSKVLPPAKINNPQDHLEYLSTVAKEFVKNLPFTTAGAVSEFANPVNAAVGGAITKIPNVNIPAPKWVDTAIADTVKVFGAPFSTLDKAAKTSMINNITDAIYEKVSPRLDELNKNFEEQYGRTPSPEDIKAQIRNKLDAQGIGNQNIAQLAQRFLNVKGQQPMAPAAPEPQALPQETPNVEPNAPGQPDQPPIVSPSVPFDEALASAKRAVATGGVTEPNIQTALSLGQIDAAGTASKPGTVVRSFGKPEQVIDFANNLDPNEGHVQRLTFNSSTNQWEAHVAPPAEAPEDNHQIVLKNAQDAVMAGNAKPSDVVNGLTLAHLDQHAPIPEGQAQKFDTLAELEKFVQENPDTKRVGMSNDGKYMAQVGTKLSSESGQTTLPGVDAAAEKIQNGLDYIKRSNEMTPVSGEIGEQLNTLRTRNKADEIRAVQLLEDAKIAPADAEAVYHHLENPKETLTAAQQEIYEKYIKPIGDARNDLFSKIRNHGLPVESDGYTPRFVADKGGIFDRLKEGSKSVGGGSILNKSTGAFKRRTMKVLTDDQGRRIVAAIKGNVVTAIVNKHPQFLGNLNFKSYEEIMNKELKPFESEARRLEKEQDILMATKGRYLASESRIDGIHSKLGNLYDKIADIYNKHSYHGGEFRDLNDRVFVDKNGKQWKIGEATTKEIEKHTDLTYHKNVLLNELVSYNKLRQIDRAMEFIDKLKSRPDFNNIGIKFGSSNVPQGWRPVNMPQFRGFAFEPRVADTLDHFYKQLKSTDNADQILTKINDFMVTSIFFNPLIHVPNIVNHWAVNRGVSGLNPATWGTLMKTSGRAIDAVIHQNADYVHMLDHGANMLYFDTSGRRLSDLMLKKMGEELTQDQQLAKKISDALGYVNPANLIKAIYKFSSQVTWATNDIATMQAVYEEMAHGKNIDQAIQDVSKHIPDYRVPARVLDSKTLADVMQNRNLTMFTRYHYGALRSYGVMVKSLIKGEGKEKLEAMDKLLMLGLITLVIYPMLDALAKKMTGDKNAMVRRAGASTFPYNTYRLAKGKIDLADYIFSILPPAPLPLFAGEELFNHDIKGNVLRRPGTEGADVLKHVVNKISPLNYYQRVQSGQMSPGKFGQGLVGISSSKTGDMSDAEILASNINKARFGSGMKNDLQIKNQQLKYQLLDKADKEGPKVLDDAVKAGEITQKQKNLWTKALGMTPLQRKIHGMGIIDTLLVAERTTPEELKTIMPMVQKKYFSALNNASGIDREQIKSLYTDFLKKQKTQ